MIEWKTGNVLKPSVHKAFNGEIDGSMLCTGI